jgi:hypothetical protein
MSRFEIALQKLLDLVGLEVQNLVIRDAALCEQCSVDIAHVAEWHHR